MPRDVSEQSDPRPDSSGLTISTIGEDLVITGNVASKGEIQLDGQLHGDIHCVSLVLGERSELEGTVIAEESCCAAALLVRSERYA
jgi:cytoskeletal protein CcmA (bactofilin family)